MPSFEDIEVITTVDLDFEVFCGTCRMGLCNESDATYSTSRRCAQVTVNACENCIEVVREEIRDDLEDQIQELQDRLTLLGESE